MKLSTKEYETPTLSVFQLRMEGILCISGAGNENYGADPGEDDSIF